jgi:hypothetical protein
MNFNDSKQLRIGRDKAHRDFARIQQFTAYHENMHKADENWDCAPELAAFHETLRADIETELQDVGYKQVENKLHLKDALKRAKEARNRANVGQGDYDFIPMTVTGDETPDELAAKVKQTIMDAIELRKRQVSETDNDEKGGK